LQTIRRRIAETVLSSGGVSKDTPHATSTDLIATHIDAFFLNAFFFIAGVVCFFIAGVVYRKKPGPTQRGMADIIGTLTHLQ
jgi:hypothetical protein